MKRRISAAPTIIALAVFAAIVLWFAAAVGNMRNVSAAEELESVRRSVENGITLCYSIEGAYPETLAYLESSYGVVYDAERYIVHYSYFAGNVRPAVTVIERAG